MNEIEEFISLFNGDTKFANGLCYWFAHILKARFSYGDIWYDQIENHFYFVTTNGAYDVFGKTTLPHSAMRWSEYKDYDHLDYQRVVRDCILKVGV
jgi:hypothetical protein